MRLQLIPQDVQRIRFAYSPLSELAACLRALAEPKRHGLILPLLQEIRHNMSVEDLQEYETLVAPLVKPFMPHFFIPTPEGQFDDFGAQLAELRATPRPEVLLELTVPFAHEGWYNASELERPGQRDRLLGTAPAPLAGVLRLAYADTPAFLERVAAFCERFWTGHFAAWWPHIEAVLVADIQRRASDMREQGLAALLGSLGHGLETTGPDAVEVDYPFGPQQVRLAQWETLVLCPSALTWPSVALEFNPPYTPMILYPALGQASLIGGTRHGLAAGAVLKALGDETRLSILKLVLGSPRHTQGLANELGLTPAAVNKHLRTLYEAGLTVKTRKGYHVEYEATPILLEQGLQAIRRELGLRL